MSETAGTGRLVAIDAADSTDIEDVASQLHESLTKRQIPALISRWDASGLFADFAAAPAQLRDVSPRTLLLLYAADLAFRCRWEIEPGLQAGQVVIAAPYITTGVTFGIAAGLSQQWLTTLLRFAPTPMRTVVLRDKGDRVWKRKPERGFGDCCTALLEATPEGFARRKTRGAMEVALSTAAETHGGFYRRRDRLDLVEDVIKARRRPAAKRPIRRRAR